MSIIQNARDIAADQFVRLQMKNPTPNHTATEWADQIQSYATFMREGAYDDDCSVQAAIAALRSVVLCDDRKAA